MVCESIQMEFPHYKKAGAWATGKHQLIWNIFTRIKCVGICEFASPLNIIVYAIMNIITGNDYNYQYTELNTSIR